MPCRVLLVDDEQSVLRALSRGLNIDFDLTTAYSADEAIRLMQDNFFPVVVTDIKMPGCDGNWLIRKANSVSPATSFIVLSGHCDDLTHAEISESECVAHYFRKPTSIDTIRDAVQGLLDKHVDACRATNAP